MKILITGASGFIGQNLVHYLDKKVCYIPRGDNEIEKITLEVDCPSHKDMDLVDFESVHDLLDPRDGTFYDWIIHCALAKNLKDNLLMWYNLLACKSPQTKILNIGSGAEYDNTRPLDVVTEEEFGKVFPTEDYKFYKYLVGKFCEEHEGCVNLRIFGCFGEGEPKDKLFTECITRALEGKWIQVYNPTRILSWVDIQDLCRIVEYCLTHELHYKSYNVCNHERYNNLQIAKMIRDMIDPNVPVYPQGFNEKPLYTGSGTRLDKEILGSIWTPMAHTIKRMIQYYKETLK